MRILIVCPYEWNRPGGVKTHIIDSAKALLKLGHKVVVISPVNGTPQLPDGWVSVGLSSEISNNVVLFPLNTGRTIHFGGTQIDVTWMNRSESEKTHRFLKVYSPNVIHFHTPWTPFFSIQLLQLAIELGNNNEIQSRFIATFHDTPSKSGLGQFLGSFVMPLVSRYFMRAFNEVIAVSEPQSRYLSRFTDQKVHIIPNGIRISHSSESSIEASKWAKFGRYLLFLGRLEHRKGVIDAIEVFRAVSNRFENVNLVIAGDGPLRKDAEILTSNYGLKNVTFTGLVSESEKWDLMTHAKLYLAPALYGESFGIVLLEALSVETPVVGYANDGYKSVISGVFDDFFVQPGDINKLAEVVSEIINDDEKLRELSGLGQELIQKHNWDVLIQEVISLYSIKPGNT